MHSQFSVHIFSKLIFLSAYTTFFWLALIVFLFGGYFFATRKMKLPGKQVLVCLGVIILFGVIGARILNAFLNIHFYIENPQRLWSIKLQGFSIFGSSLAIPFGWIFCRAMKMDVWKFADALTPFLGIGIALMRIGCFLNGCCFGRPTTLPWGVTFPDFGRAHVHQIANNPLGFLSGSIAVHPTQLYELFAALLGSAIVFWLIKKQSKPGIAFLVFATGFSFFRLLNNLLRVQPETFDAPFLFYPLLYSFFVILGGVFIFLKK